MSLLELVVTDDAVTARLGERRAVVPVETRASSAHGWPELRPDDVWQAALAAARGCLDADGQVDAVRVVVVLDAVALWDADTLGAPRAAIVAPTPDALDWVAAHEPHTWALVVAGRYAIGDLGSYLVARMTRGTYHVTGPGPAARTGLLDDTGAWSAERGARHGVPLDALPEVLADAPLARTDARSFLDLAVPVVAVDS